MPSWDRRAPKVGEKAPDLTLVDPEGKRTALSSVKGRKPLVLLLFAGEEDREGLRLLRDYRDETLAIWRAGAALCGVGPVEAMALRALRADRGLGFPLLADPDGQSLSGAGLVQSAGVYVLDGDWTVKHRALGDAAAPEVTLSILRRAGIRRSRPGLGERARSFAHALRHPFQILRPAR
jgi:peroxiredoxin